MKLIRLLTDNNGFFKSSFGNEMTIKENAKMALLNLTFQTEFEVLTIDSRNNKVSFITDTSDASTEVEVSMLQRNYNRDEIEEFYDDLKYSLNSAISNLALNNGIGSAFDIRFANGLRQIEYRYSPFLNPLNLPNQGNIMNLDNDLIDVESTAFGSGNYRDLPSGGTYAQNSPTATVTFDTTDLGPVARYRSTTTQSPGGTTKWWKNKVGSETGWFIYSTQPLTANAVPSGQAEIDPNTGVLTINAGAQTYTPNTKPPDFIPAGGTTTLSLKSGVLADPDGRNNNIITGIGKLSLGSGMMTARIKASQTNGSGVQDNGFALCLTKTPLTEKIVPGDDIDVADRDFEIRFNRAGETYKFINKASGDSLESDSGVQPNSVLATEPLHQHDIIFYEVIGNKINGGVLQDLTPTGGIVTKSIFFTYEMKPEDSFFPYIYIRGVKADISVDMFNYTINPWINNQYDNITEDTPPYWELTGQNKVDNPSSALTNGVQVTIDDGNIFAGTGVNAFNLPQVDRWSLKKTSQITLPSQIWDFLGYNLRIGMGYDDEAVESKTIFMGPNDGRSCWNFWSPLQEPEVGLSDNFLVESMSVPLDSYDASEIFYSSIKDANGNAPQQDPKAEKKGRRKNILMTLPVNNNTNGLIEYEASNLIFIDINNPEKINLRNMNFRILNKSFIPIRQSGESAVMTILID